MGDTKDKSTTGGRALGGNEGGKIRKQRGEAGGGLRGRQ